MEKHALFPQIGGFVYGGDYNPDQWLDCPDILKKDVELMKEAGINCATLGIFAWSAYERREGEYTFDWLQEIMDNLYANGIYTILATPSGARPAWLDARYPDAMRCDANGVRNHHGTRHNHCMSSLNYRRKVREINSRLGERFAHHPGLLMWHISNEYGGECYCPSCCRRFREFLAEKYDHDIEKLNHAWWTGFWSHRFNSFDEVDPPYANGESCVLGQNLDWKRFTTYITNEFMRAEIDTVKAFNPAIPVTTNFMEFDFGLDYHVMARELDTISWDCYPRMHNDWEPPEDTFLWAAFNHALFRSMKRDRPFMLMESAPGVVNWQDVNKYRRPGYLKLLSLQAVACGSDTVQYFQIRKGRGSSEQHHGALIDHMGTNETRIFKEAAEVGEMLKRIRETAGTLADNRAAILINWDNRWAVNDARILSQKTKRFDDVCIALWKELQRLGVEADIVAPDSDLSPYGVVVAPMLYLLNEGVGENLKNYVAKGGQLLATYFTGWVEEHTLTYLGGFPGQGLQELFGLISEETDALYPSDRNAIRILPGGEEREVRDYQELLRLGDAEVVAEYTGDYLAGKPAVTVKQYGLGHAWYCSCRLAPKDMDFIFEKMLSDAGIAVSLLPEGIEHHTRYAGEYRYDFYLNPTQNPKTFAAVQGYDVLNSINIEQEITLAPCGAAVIRSEIRK